MNEINSPVYLISVNTISCKIFMNTINCYTSIYIINFISNFIMNTLNTINVTNNNNNNTVIYNEFSISFPNSYNYFLYKYFQI